jgi:hypothetical protein
MTLKAFDALRAHAASAMHAGPGAGPVAEAL